jgi:hypothetical protein
VPFLPQELAWLYLLKIIIIYLQLAH